MPTRRTVVVVDDDAHLRRTVARLLGRQGYTVEEAVDGSDGVHCFSRLRDEGRRPVALVTDADMPTMNGPDMVATLAGEGHLKHVTLVLMSGATPAWAVTVQLYGGQLLSKPFTAMELLNALTTTVI